MTTGVNYNIVSYCYVYGGTSVLGDNAGALITNCYATNGSWVDTDAISAGITGSEWVDIAPSSTNVPYLLSSFNTNFYNGVTKTTVLGSTLTNLTLTNIFNPSTFTILSGATSSDVSIGSVYPSAGAGQLTYIGGNTGIVNKFNLQILNGYNYDNVNNLYLGYNIINFTFTSIPYPINTFINSGVRNVRIG